MIWKPQEKELSREEAIELAKKELARYWFGSSPLITAVKIDGKTIAFPLDPIFTEKTWLVVVVDPTDLNTESVADFLKVMQRRYASNQVDILGIICPIYTFLVQSRAPIEAYLEKHQITFPVAIDFGGGLIQAFEVSRPPKVLLVGQGKRLYEYEGSVALGRVEPDIQSFLRLKDPGLPLLPMFAYPKELSRESSRIELGFHPILGIPANFTEPNFKSVNPRLRAGKFYGLLSEKEEPSQIVLSGLWNQDSEKLMTTDPNAFLQFESDDEQVSVVAQNLGNSKEAIQVAVEVDGGPVAEDWAGNDLSHAEAGFTFVSVTIPKVYQMLGNNVQKARKITLRFVNLAGATIAIYGIRANKRTALP